VAIYRFEAKIISRNGERSTVASASYRTGRCATSAAAYRAGAELVDERSGQRYDYTAKRGVMGAAILLPASAPAWMADRSKLWNAVEKIEMRKDAQLARDFILTLPHELTHEQRETLTREFVQTQFVAKGYAADIAWHSPHKGDSLNHHAHVMVPLRKVEAGGFARLKERPPSGAHPAMAWQAELLHLRQAWETAVNRHLAAAGFDVRVDRRSLKERGIDRAPQIKRGPIGRGEVIGQAGTSPDRQPGRGSGGCSSPVERGGSLAAVIQPAEALRPSSALPQGAAAPGNGETARAGFRAAGQVVTARPASRQSGPGRRGKVGGGSGTASPPDGGGRFSARNLAADHLKLCHHPLKDLPRWLAEDKKRAAPAPRLRQVKGRPTTGKGQGHGDDARQRTGNAEASRLRLDPLPQLRGGLDADGGRGWCLDGVSARQRASLGRYDRLRSLRDEGRARSVAAAPRNAPPQARHRAAAPSRVRTAPAIPAVPTKAGWPDPMKRELAACRTLGDYLAWERKWVETLAGRVLATEAPVPKSLALIVCWRSHEP
jgi:hypothetical protein